VNETDSRAPLSITTEDLTLTVDGVELDVRSTGDRVFVEAESVRDAIRVARGLPDGDATGPAALLTATDLTTEFRVRGRTVAVLGAAAPPVPSPNSSVLRQRRSGWRELSAPQPEGSQRSAEGPADWLRNLVADR